MLLSFEKNIYDTITLRNEKENMYRSLLNKINKQRDDL